MRYPKASMLTQWVQILVQKPLLNALLALIYFIVVVALHSEVGALINGSFETVSRGTYNMLIAGLVVLMGVILCWRLRSSYLIHPFRQSLKWIIAYSLVAVILCFVLLFVINIEAIHFVQYAILALLLYPMTQSMTATMVLATIAGALDELYQYLVLDTAALYYDFNDVLLDSIGAGIGLTCLTLLSASSRAQGQANGQPSRIADGQLPRQAPFPPRRAAWYKRIEWILLLLIALILMILYLTGDFAILQNPEAPESFSLFKTAPTGFWHYPEGPYARFHILSPIPGLILIGLTCWVYARLDDYYVVGELD